MPRKIVTVTMTLAEQGEGDAYGVEESNDDIARDVKEIVSESVDGVEYVSVQVEDEV